ncbi:MAG TPA: protein kinase [Thermoanaerobaculia bacterium]|nr:protein kinase [Thermoanaerobaculia bacterium]
MALAARTRLGTYEILAPLGAGGMGEVYRAKDTRLEREVAVKVLPDSFAKDEAALARFTREAKAVAALSHPNILAIFELGQQNGTAFAVTELLEGETLRERLAGGALPQRKAVDLAVQIANGLAAAHEKGIVHRDLKPENLFVTHDGRVKILDFGLAKQNALAASTDTHSPTTPASTEPGTVMGTVGYMAPEQVKGLPADHRADIFAFGCVLYEMLTGRRAFQRETSAETMTAILKEDPPELAAEDGAISTGLRNLLRHALEKSPSERIQSARDLAIFLQSSSSPSTAKTTIRPARDLAALLRRVLVPALAFAAGALVVRLTSRPKPHGLASIRALTFSGADAFPAVSPDGRSLAFTSSRDGKQRVWIKQLATGGEAVLTSGEDNFPRFSPDGSQILFIRSDGDRHALYRQAVVGGEPRNIVDGAITADFMPDGRSIVFLRFATDANGTYTTIERIGIEGGETRLIARTPLALNHPRVSPDGKTIVATQLAQGGAPASIFVVGADGKDARTLATGGVGSLSSSAFVSNDEVIYSKALSASGTVTGSEARFSRQNLASGRAVGFLWSALSSRVVDVLGPGRIVFDTGSPRENVRELRLGSTEPPRWLTHGSSTDRQPVYSRDGKWVLFSSNRSGNLDLWEVSTENGAVRRVTDDAAEDWDPAFSVDGSKLLWSSNRSGAFEIWMAEADGGGARQISHDGVDAENPTETPDGWVVYTSGNLEKGGIWKMRRDGSQATRLAKGGTLLVPEVSPDGRWITYVQSAAGVRNTINVISSADGSPAPFTIDVGATTAATYTSVGLYGRARWRPDGKALVFVGRDENGVNGVYEQEFAPGRDTTKTRRRLAPFDPDVITETLALSPDGTRLSVGSFDRVFSVMLAENVEGVDVPPRGGR